VSTHETILICAGCGLNSQVDDFEQGKSYACRACPGVLEQLDTSEQLTKIRPMADDTMPEDARHLLNDLVRHFGPSVQEGGGRFLLLRELGRGGMGVVWKGWDRQLGRYVAVKFISSQWSEQSLGRFRQEARILARLQHPNIAGIYDVGSAESRTKDGKTVRSSFIVMQFVEGATIDKTPPPDLAGIAGSIATMARALQYAHKQKVVHRDVKPSNIMRQPDGHVYLMDFGIAKAVQGDGGGAGLTMTQQIMGTPSFMSPEQASGSASELDARSDVYSLGATLYKLATGVPPFSGKTAQELLIKVATTAPPSPSSVRPGFPGPLETVIMKAMAQKLEDRYQTCEAMANALEAVKKRLEETPENTLATGPMEPLTLQLPTTHVTAPQVAPPTDVTVQPALEPPPRPKWRIPAAIAGIVVLSLVVFLILRSGPAPVDLAEKTAALARTVGAGEYEDALARHALDPETRAKITDRSALSKYDELADRVKQLCEQLKAVRADEYAADPSALQKRYEDIFKRLDFPYALDAARRTRLDQLITARKGEADPQVRKLAAAVAGLIKGEQYGGALAESRGWDPAHEPYVTDAAALQALKADRDRLEAWSKDVQEARTGPPAGAEERIAKAYEKHGFVAPKAVVDTAVGKHLSEKHAALAAAVGAGEYEDALTRHALDPAMRAKADRAALAPYEELAARVKQLCEKLKEVRADEYAADPLALQKRYDAISRSFAFDSFTLDAGRRTRLEQLITARKSEADQQARTLAGAVAGLIKGEKYDNALAESRRWDAAHEPYVTDAAALAGLKADRARLEAWSKELPAAKTDAEIAKAYERHGFVAPKPVVDTAVGKHLSEKLAALAEAVGAGEYENALARHALDPAIQAKAERSALGTYDDLAGRVKQLCEQLKAVRADEYAADPSALQKRYEEIFKRLDFRFALDAARRTGLEQLLSARKAEADGQARRLAAAVAELIQGERYDGALAESRRWDPAHEPYVTDAAALQSLQAYRKVLEAWSKEVAEAKSAGLQPAEAEQRIAKIYEKHGFVAPEEVPRLRWRSERLGKELRSTPCVHRGKVYVGCRDFKLYCFDAATGKREWEHATEGMIDSSPAAADDLLVFGSADGTIHAIDLRDRSKPMALKALGRIVASPAVAGGLAYFGTLDQRFVGVKPGADKPAWEFQAGSRVTAAAAVADGRVYFTTGEPRLYCVKAEGPPQVWSWGGKPFTGFGSAPAVGDGRVFVTGEDGELFAVESAGGKLDWTYNATERTSAAPTAAGGTVYFCSDQGEKSTRVHAVEAKTGNRRWAATIDGVMRDSTVCPAGDTVYVATREGILYGLSDKDGKPVMRFELGGGVWNSSPVIDGRDLYIGLQDGTVVCVRVRRTAGPAWPMLGGGPARAGRQ